MKNLTTPHPRVFTRYYNITPASTSSGPVSVQYNDASTAEHLQRIRTLPNLKAIEHVEVDAVGAPPSALSVTAPPSVALYIRRNTLMTLQASLSKISISPFRLNPITSFVHGNITSRYQQLVGTEPFSVLVSANAPSLLPRFFKRTTSKSFANIVLDGTTDWAFLKRDALHAYTGPSLDISVRRLPVKISRALSKRLELTSREPTGLFKWFKSGYVFVHGRGTLGVVGNGLVYSAVLGEDEEISVQRNSLVGVSVNGPHDLENCVVKYSNPLRMENIMPNPPPKSASWNSWNDLKMQFRYYYWHTAKVINSLRKTANNHFIGNSEFVRVIGPRSILIQSGTPHESFERTYQLPSLMPRNSVDFSHSVAREKKPEDYLNIVTIDPKLGPVIESTKDFKGSIKSHEI